MLLGPGQGTVSLLGNCIPSEREFTFSTRSQPFLIYWRGRRTRLISGYGNPFHNLSESLIRQRIRLVKVTSIMRTWVEVTPQVTGTQTVPNDDSDSCMMWHVGGGSWMNGDPGNGSMDPSAPRPRHSCGSPVPDDLLPCISSYLTSPHLL